jgi:hypothetical protein
MNSDRNTAHDTINCVNRRCLLAFVAVLTACSGDPPKRNVLPETIAGEWTRKEHATPPPASAPEKLTRFGVQGVETARYENAAGGVIRVEVYDVRSDAAALELEQTWRHEADTVVFHRSRYFVVMRFENAGREALNAFVRELEKLLQ